MSKKKLLILQVFTIIVLVCTSVYATVSATISLNADKTSVYRGDTVKVTLSLKDVEATDKVTSIEGYVNYDKNVIEDVTWASIVKNSDNTINIGNETLIVEDVTSGKLSQSSTYFGFNSDPASDNDTKFVIDFENGISSNTDLFTINFKVKSNATYGEIKNAITYKAFVITVESDQISQEITKNVDLTINKVNTDPDSDPDPDSTKTLTGIAITTAPSKTSYKAGDTFDKTGMVVTAGYSDGTKKVVSNYTYTPTAALKTSDKTITVSYTEGGVTKTATQSITVTENQDTGKTLSSISITKAPNKTNYESGETFDKSGMVVKAKYSDGTEKEITGYTTSPTSILTTSDKTITVSYTEGGVTKTTTQNITVSAKGSNNNSNTNNGNTNKNVNNTNKTSNSIDNTVSGNTLPATGAKVFIAPVLILAVLAYASYKKYSNYKGI